LDEATTLEKGGTEASQVSFNFSAEWVSPYQEICDSSPGGNTPRIKLADMKNRVKALVKNLHKAVQ
jgi:hypothetical protein